MGIPSYFSYIVRNHANIIYKYNPVELPVDNLYMDCNSIIYDCIHNYIHELELLCGQSQDIELYKKIIQLVIAKIDQYIAFVNPSKWVFIAFDGVAPVAKMNQQRQRRYRTTYEAEQHKTKKTQGISTLFITPGTVFMNTLNSAIKEKYCPTATNSENNVQTKNTKRKSKKKETKKETEIGSIKTGLNIRISGSDEPGEGEHKLFQWMRDQSEYHRTTRTVIYGLDADLIMLCVNHLTICPNIFLYRETPEFIRSINSSMDPGGNYLLNIHSFAENIYIELFPERKLGSETSWIGFARDYIFICFFLGNDFMPHFPALNIRTQGIGRILDAYKKTILANNNNFFVIYENNETKNIKIQWKIVRQFVNLLADNEDEFMRIEMIQRDKMEKFSVRPGEDPEETKPMRERMIEKYIQAPNFGWEWRYYKTLFDIDSRDPQRIAQICKNYVAGLEWNLAYYTQGCYDWRWSYHYHYPPLLKDLVKYIPFFELEKDNTTLSENYNNPVSAIVQLCYVLPGNHLINLIPSNYQEKIKTLLTLKEDWYPSQEKYPGYETKICWAYCKYLWESHLLLPEITIEELEKLL
jgi:5'-3' exonuclease